MSILRTNNRNKDTKLIGAVVLPHVHQYLTLYTLAKGTTKAQLFKDLIEEWILAKRATETDDVLVTLLLDRIDDQWMQEQDKMTFDTFKNLIKEEMEDKGLKASYINAILSKMSPYGIKK